MLTRGGAAQQQRRVRQEGPERRAAGESFQVAGDNQRPGHVAQRRRRRSADEDEDEGRVSPPLQRLVLCAVGRGRDCPRATPQQLRCGDERRFRHGFVCVVGVLAAAHGCDNCAHEIVHRRDVEEKLAEVQTCARLDPALAAFIPLHVGHEVLFCAVEFDTRISGPLALQKAPRRRVGVGQPASGEENERRADEARRSLAGTRQRLRQRHHLSRERRPQTTRGRRPRRARPRGGRRQ
mmetsp:Transcript_16177/g.54564  ORF Transcript_16177/g.54564 Transcript_16177/m.54564 type:complete len:237 (+) Transcript_16177:223-933(+)